MGVLQTVRTDRVGVPLLLLYAMSLCVWCVSSPTWQTAIQAGLHTQAFALHFLPTQACLPWLPIPLSLLPLFQLAPFLGPSLRLFLSRGRQGGMGEASCLPGGGGGHAMVGRTFAKSSLPLPRNMAGMRLPHACFKNIIITIYL